MEAIEFPIVDNEKILLDYYGYDVNEATKSEWYQISQIELSKEFAEKYEDKIDWEEQFRNYILDEDILRKHIHKIETPAVWFFISYHYKLSPEFILEFQNKLDLDSIISQQELPLKLILKWAKKEEYHDLIEKVFENQKITSKLIMNIEKIDRSLINWHQISSTARITKSLLRAVPDKLFWNVVCRDRDLSEETLIEFKDYVDWIEVSKNQKMSKDFILKMYNYVDIKALKDNKKINQNQLSDEGVYVYLNLMK